MLTRCAKDAYPPLLCPSHLTQSSLASQLTLAMVGYMVLLTPNRPLPFFHGPGFLQPNFFWDIWAHAGLHWEIRLKLLKSATKELKFSKLRVGYEEL